MPREPVAQYYLGLGIDESAQDWVLEPQQALSEGINTRIDKRGAIVKRRGHTGLGRTKFDASSISAAGRMFAHGKQLCIADFHNAYSYINTASKWVEQDEVPEPTQVRRRIIELPELPSSFDAIDVGSYVAVAYVWSNDSSGFTEIVGLVVDPVSWTVVSGPTTITVGLWDGSVSLGKVGSKAVAFYSPSANDLAASYIDCTSATTINSGWSTTGSLATDYSGDTFDASWSSNLDRVYLAYSDNSTVGYTVSSYNSSLTLIESDFITATSPSYICLSEEVGGTLFCAYEDTNVLYVIGLDHDDLDGTNIGTATSTGLSAADQWNSIVATASDAGHVLASEQDSNGLSAYRPFTVSGGAIAMAAAASNQFGVTQDCRQFYVDGRNYCALRPINSVFPIHYDASVAIAEVNPSSFVYPRPVSNGTQLLAPKVTWIDTPLPHVVTLDTYKRGVPTITQRNSGPDTFALDLLVLDFRDSRRLMPAPFGEDTLLSGGCPVVYDGDNVDEAGFVFRPGAPSGSAGVAGNVTSSSSLYYIVTWRAVDSNGQEIVSGVSDPSADVGAVAAKVVTVTVPYCPMTARKAAASGLRMIYVDVWRSIDGGAYRYVGTTEQDLFTNAGSVAFTDDEYPSTVDANAKLYRQAAVAGVQGTSLNHEAPPPLHYPVNLNGMLVAWDDSLRSLRNSSQHVSGEQPWFSSIWQVPIPGDDGTGLAVLDGRLLAFHRSSVWLVDGSPPADNGIGGLGTPQRLSSDVGCIEPRSILSTSSGVFFQSERGLELMTRSLDVNWIGEPISNTLDDNPIITSAVLDGANNLAIFTLAESESNGATGTNGVRLVYDLSIQRWVSTDKVTDYLGVANRAAQDACIVYENSAWRYAWVDSAAYVHTENASDAAKAHLDVGASDTWVTMTAVTGWTRLRGPSAEQLIDRAILLTRRESDLDANVYIGYDYSDSYSTTKQWLHAATTGKTKMLLDAETGNERLGESVRVKFTDAAPTSGTVGTGQGCTLVALTYEGEARSGAHRTNSGER